MNKQADIALIGIAVMGENLALNIASQGYKVIVSSRKQDKIDAFLNDRAKDKAITGTTDMEELVNALKKPRKIMLMVKAGDPVDMVIESLLPLLDQGDVIIDGGNSNYEDTTRRTRYLKENGIYFIGTGVSGGEEGALKGPSIMPGGAKEAWPIVKDILQSISAKVDGAPCCEWVGPEGAGHFVKMVHNGIEYGDMQLIGESYHTMRALLGLTPEKLGEIFTEWNKSELDSYLIEITADIMKVKDEDGQPLLDKILDSAGQKGTGKWTAHASLESGVPLSLIAESVYSRFLSSLKDERLEASKVFNEKPRAFEGDQEALVEHLRKALYAAKILSYTQGFALMKKAATDFEWDLDYGSVALMWRGGCIIRSRFLGDIKKAFDKNNKLSNLLLDDFFKGEIESTIESLRIVVSTAALHSIPVPAFSAALNYFHGYKSATLPANLVQAQRDYFGAHTYERIDKKRGEFFHTDWTGRGGKTSSTTYDA